jgi:hypothetical protein
MPYELSFTKRISIADREEYINECCVGGDFVVNQLLPVVEARYTDIQTEQEDWGWFIWFRAGSTSLAIDIFTDDADVAAFRVHLTSRVKRLLVSDKIVDTPELEMLRALVVAELTPWVDGTIAVQPLDASYL